MAQGHDKRSLSTTINSQPSALHFFGRHIRRLRIIDTCAATCAHSRNEAELPPQKTYSNLILAEFIYVPNVSKCSVHITPSHRLVPVTHSSSCSPLPGATRLVAGASGGVSRAAKWLEMLGTNEIEVPQLPVHCADALGRNPYWLCTQQE